VLPSISLTFHSHFAGEIIGCRTNCPGSWHDARVAESIYTKLEEKTPEGYFLISDTAFPALAGKIKKPLRAGRTLRGTQAQIDELVAFDHQLLSARQAVEWGMRTIQGSFGRLRLPLPADQDEERGEMLEICFRLTNVRARKVGINQIASTYIPELEKRESDQFWDQVTEHYYPNTRRGRVSRYQLVVEEQN
jgi:hypothetical protein